MKKTQQKQLGVGILILVVLIFGLTSAGVLKFQTFVDQSKVYLQPKFDIYSCEPVGSARDANYTGGKVALSAPTTECPNILGIATGQMATFYLNQNTNTINAYIKMTYTDIFGGVNPRNGANSAYYRINGGGWQPINIPTGQSDYFQFISGVTPASQKVDVCSGASGLSMYIGYSYQPYGLRKYSGISGKVVDFTAVPTYPSCNLQALDPADANSVCIEDPTGKYCLEANFGLLLPNTKVNAWSGGYGLSYLPADIKTLPSGQTGVCTGSAVVQIQKITLKNGEEVQVAGDQIATYGAGQTLQCCPDSRGINTVCGSDWKWQSQGSTADTCQYDSQCTLGATVVYDSGTYQVQPANPLVGVTPKCTAGKCDYTNVVALGCSPYAPAPQGKVCASNGQWVDSLIGGNVTRPITDEPAVPNVDWGLIILILIPFLTGLIAYMKSRDKVMFVIGVIGGVIISILLYAVYMWLLKNWLIVVLGGIGLGAFGAVILYLIGGLAGLAVISGIIGSGRNYKRND